DNSGKGFGIPLPALRFAKTGNLGNSPAPNPPFTVNGHPRGSFKTDSPSAICNNPGKSFETIQANIES
ncbi:hypothetical protein BLA29_003882, partial [Euroglyphus maynei]